MKKLALALLAVFILPASLSATGSEKPAPKKSSDVTWTSWTYSQASSGASYTYEGAKNNYGKLIIGAVVAALGYAAYSKHCPQGCSSAKVKPAAKK